jgi:hypothetical protein
MALTARMQLAAATADLFHLRNGTCRSTMHYCRSTTAIYTTFVGPVPVLVLPRRIKKDT